MTWSGLCHGVGAEPWVMDGGRGLVRAALVCVCSRVRACVCNHVSLQPVWCTVLMLQPHGKERCSQG